MIPRRILDIDIQNKSLLSVFYGKVNDLFITADIIQYNFEEIIYLYLKNNDFDSVVFYSNVESFYSFSNRDLEILLTDSDKIEMPIVKNSKRRGPLGFVNIAPNIQNQEISNQPFVEFSRNNRKAYRSNVTRIFTVISNALANSKFKIAVIVNQAMLVGTRFFSDLTLTAFLIDKYTHQHSLLQQHRIIFNYGTQESFKEGDLPNEIMNQLFSLENEKYILKNECNIKIGLPEKEEVESLLNYLRLEKNISIFYENKYEKLKAKLLQKRLDIIALKGLKIEELIRDINNKSAWNRLDDFKGINNIIEQFRKNINAIKKNRERIHPIKIRPHMCFKGNPGTGKTVIAEIFADILREENILSIGGLEKVTVGDLISEHVGGTRIKTQEVCKKAKGGVLFIDEAYGLNNEDGTNSFGKEAIEVLIQFMENNEDSLVILAGYTTDIDKLLKEGNKGFTSRFNSNYHFNFNDYDADTLFSIATTKLKGFELSDSFKLEIKKVIEKMTRQKDENWGNARSIESLVQDIVSNFYNSNSSTIMENHIPANLKEKSNNDLQNGINSLDSLVGLEKMKKTLNNILNSIKADKLRNELNNIKNPDYNLNFVFSGNPGTGKTTVARMMGDLLYNLQLISSSNVIELTRDNIIGRYQGETGPNVTKAFDKAIGKVLFIDEAYAICRDERDTYGREAVDTIVANLTKPKYMGKMVVILAGYSEDMVDFIQKNPGLDRRISYKIEFEDYTNEDLWKILKLKINSLGLQIKDTNKDYAIDYFAKLPRNKSFANAGAADRLVGILKSNLDNRIANIDSPSKEDLTTIHPFDFPNYSLQTEIVEPNSVINKLI